MNPSSAKVRFELGKLYLRIGKNKDANQELVRATELDPQHVGAHYQLGQLYKRTGKADLGRKQLAISEQLRKKDNRTIKSALTMGH